MSALSIAVPIVIKLVERLKGRGNGPEKKSVAMGILRRIMDAFKDQPGVGLPGEDELGRMVDETVRSMNENRALIGEGTVVAEGVTDPQLAALGVQMIQQGMALLKRGGIG